MIKLTRLNGRSIVVNAEILGHLEETPDTLISFSNGQKLAVRESLDEVIHRVVEYQRSVRQPPATSHSRLGDPTRPEQMRSDEDR